MASAQNFLVIERILRDRKGVWEQISEDRDLKPLSGQMLLSSAIALAGYGAVLGASNGWLQAIASAVKLPILFLVTLAICMPTLYLFNLVFGAKLSLGQAVAMVSVAITVMTMLSLAFAPISLFFLITAPNYSFYKLLNVAIMALTAIIGLRFLVVGMRTMNAVQEAAEAPVPVPEPRPEPALVAAGPVQPNGMPPQVVMPPPLPATPPQRQASMGLLYIWIVVFGFVGTQLAWTLRPFLGSPDEPFQIFRHIEGNFYINVVHTIGQLF